MLRPLSLLVVALFLLNVSLGATAVITFRTPERIVISADSMLNDGRMACKITSTGRWWTLTAGFMYATNPSFDVQAEVRKAFADAQDLAAVRELLTARVYRPLVAVIEHDKAAVSVQKLYHPGDSFTSITVAGTNAHDSILRVGLYQIRVMTVEPVRLSAAWYECPGDCPDGRMFNASSVAEGPIVGRVTAPRVWWVEDATATAARFLVAEQALHAPDLVGGPIDTLVIDATGAKWFARDHASLCVP